MNFFWLLRMSRWARRPPSMRRVMIVAAVIAISLSIFLVERYVGLPDWMAIEPAKRGQRIQF